MLWRVTMLWCEFARAAAVGALEGGRGVGSVWGGAGEKRECLGSLHKETKIVPLYYAIHKKRFLTTERQQREKIGKHVVEHVVTLTTTT